MHRRSFLFALLLSPFTASAQVGKASRIAILTDFVNAIGAAGEAISNLTKGFRDLRDLGWDTYKKAAAVRERDHLIDLSRRTTNLITYQNIIVVQNLDEYLAKPYPTQDDWEVVVGQFKSTLTAVHNLLADVKVENSDFVLESAFLQLNEALSSRVPLLTQLATMTAPRSKEEISILRKASAKYKLLIANTKEALTQLNAYIKNRPGN